MSFVTNAGDEVAIGTRAPGCLTPGAGSGAMSACVRAGGERVRA